MDTWQYEPLHDLDQPFLERLRNFPREPDMLVYGARLTAAFMIRQWLRVYHRLSISGQENLPKSGSFVMVANHASHLDALCLLAALSYSQIHRAFPAAAKDYFFENAGRLLFAAVVVNALPFERHASPRQSLSLCRQLLENTGNILVIFPEGTRSQTGELREFKAGVGLLVAGTNYPVVPCYLEGAQRAWPKGCWLPRPHKISLRIGPPRQYPQLERNKESAEQISQDLRAAVLALV